MAMAPSSPLDCQRSSPSTPSHFPLSTSCLFAPTASLSRWHRSISQSPNPSDDPPAAAVPSLLPPPQISGSPRASAELSVVGSPQKRFFYSAFNVNEEIVEDDGLDDCIQHPEKRTRRLSVMQVKSLEKAFDLDNRLEPERKEQLAKQLDLQARQVAVWFQNRRARWKTKQMERDYQSLKKQLESLKAERDELKKEKEKLAAEVIRLRNDMSNGDRVKLAEASSEARRSSHSEISSCVTAREYFEHAELTSSDQKDKDGSSTTYDSDGSAIDDNVYISTRTENRGSVSVPSNVTNSGDIALMQAETYGFPDLPDLYHGKIACGSRAMEDMFCAEVENYSGFVPLDWWEAN